MDKGGSVRQHHPGKSRHQLEPFPNKRLCPHCGGAKGTQHVSIALGLLHWYVADFYHKMTTLIVFLQISVFLSISQSLSIKRINHVSFTEHKNDSMGVRAVLSHDCVPWKEFHWLYNVKHNKLHWVFTVHSSLSPWFSGKRRPQGSVSLDERLWTGGRRWSRGGNQCQQHVAETWRELLPLARGGLCLPGSGPASQRVSEHTKCEFLLSKRFLHFHRNL